MEQDQNNKKQRNEEKLHFFILQNAIDKQKTFAVKNIDHRKTIPLHSIY
jgi:hypothetical protein